MITAPRCLLLFAADYSSLCVGVGLSMIEKDRGDGAVEIYKRQLSIWSCLVVLSVARRDGVAVYAAVLRACLKRVKRHDAGHQAS